jgi:hypothetical protein
MSLLYFALATLSSVILGCLLGTRLLGHGSESGSGGGRLRMRPRLWFSLGAIVVISCAAVWAIFQHHVLLGVGVLVAAYALQLAVLQILKSKNDGQRGQQ